MPEHVLFSDIDSAAVMSAVSLDSVAGVDDRAMFSSSDAVRSMASPSSLPTEDLASSTSQLHRFTSLCICVCATDFLRFTLSIQHQDTT